MKKLLLLLLMVTYGATLSAQIFWEERATTFTAASRGVSQISFADENNVWINAYDGVTVANVIQEWARSTDGGNTWINGVINIGNPALGIGSIQARSATKAYTIAYVSAGGAGGGVWVTNDTGASWTKQPSAVFSTPVDAFPNWVYFWDDNEGIAMGDPTNGYFEVYKTTNGGANWNRIASSNLPTPLEGEYGYVRNFTVVGDNIWFGTNMGRLVKSNNRGNDFGTVAYQSPLSDFGSAGISGSYAFQDANNGILIGNEWQFWRTVDGGVTWSSESPEGVVRNGDVCWVPGTTNTYVSLGTDIDNELRGSSYTTDGGLSWTDVNTLDPGDDIAVDGTGAVAFANPSVGLAGGFSTSATVGGIFKFVGDPSVLTLANVDFKSADVATATPNPTTGILNVAGKNISQITVFDVLGKQVSTTNYSALSNVALDFGSLNSGVYMVKVTNDLGNTSTVKVVKQ